MEDKIIIQSRHKWLVYPSILAAALLLFAMCTKLFWELIGLFLIDSGGARLGIMLVGTSITILTFGFCAIWFMRSVKVYSDRIEVKYLLHPKWNYQIMLKDVDCFCVETKQVETEKSYYQYSRIYLLTGRKLWLYISGGEGSNSDEMFSFMTEQIGITQRKGTIKLSWKEEEVVKHGGYISLDDISDEELEAMAAQRKQRPQPRSDFEMPRSTRWKYFFIEYGVILFIAVFVAIFYFGWVVSRAVKENNTETLSYIDAKTDLSSKLYYIVDSIDVDSTGILCLTLQISYSRNNLKYWAFPIKGRDNVWIAVTVNDCQDVKSLEDYESTYCLKALRKIHSYKVVTYEEEYRKIIEEIAKSSGVKIDENFILLCPDRMLRTGRVSYFAALDTRKRSKHAEEEVFRLMKDAAEEVPAAQYQLGWMYESGLGVVADTAEAICMYTKAAVQNQDAKAKIDAMNQMSYLYARRRQYEKALAVIDSAIAVSPYEANLYDSKGEHLYRSGDKEGAEVMWKRVMELDPQFTEKHDSELYRLLHGK